MNQWALIATFGSGFVSAIAVVAYLMVDAVGEVARSRGIDPFADSREIARLESEVARLEQENEQLRKLAQRAVEFAADRVAVAAAGERVREKRRNRRGG